MLKLVITLVLYFGERRWKRRTLHDCLDIPEAVRPYVSDYRINVFEIASKELRNLPNVGNYILLELDYKCDNNFLIGMYIHTSQSGVMDKELYYLKATDVWKKVYLNFSPTVTESFNADYFKFYFRGYNGEADTTNFYFDNLKLIYLE